MSKDMEKVVSEDTRRSGRNGRFKQNGVDNWEELNVTCRGNILADPRTERIQLKSVCPRGKPIPSFFKPFWTLYSSFLDWRNYWLVCFCFCFFKSSFCCYGQNSFASLTFNRLIGSSVGSLADFWMVLESISIYIVTVICIHTTVLFLQTLRMSTKFVFLSVILMQRNFVSFWCSFLSGFTRVIKYCAHISSLSSKESWEESNSPFLQ